MREQLLERQTWEDFGDIDCSAEIDPVRWRAPFPEEAKLLPVRLAQVIEANVVPRLVIAHRGRAVGEVPSLELSAEIVDEFSRLVLVEEHPVLAAHLERLHVRGASYELLYLKLLAAAARRLGEFWDADITDFATVTIGLWRLQELLRSFSLAFQSEGSKPANGHRALLLSTPGEQHNFGLSMIGEFLFREGWSVAGGPGFRSGEIEGLIRDQVFSMVGFTLSSESGLDTLADAIALVRKTSRNRGVVVLVGGALFIRCPELVPQVGADATAVDARECVIKAGQLVAAIGSRG